MIKMFVAGKLTVKPAVVDKEIKGKSVASTTLYVAAGNGFGKGYSYFEIEAVGSMAKLAGKLDKDCYVSVEARVAGSADKGYKFYCVDLCAQGAKANDTAVEEGSGEDLEGIALPF